MRIQNIVIYFWTSQATTLRARHVPVSWPTPQWRWSQLNVVFEKRKEKKILWIIFIASQEKKTKKKRTGVVWTRLKEAANVDRQKWRPVHSDGIIQHSGNHSRYEAYCIHIHTFSAISTALHAVVFGFSLFHLPVRPHPLGKGTVFFFFPPRVNNQTCQWREVNGRARSRHAVSGHEWKG